jgi:hypothetical protein
MEWNELSLAGKKKLRRWYEMQQKNNVRMCISKIVSGAKDEPDLFKTCRRINRALKILREDVIGSQTSQEVQTPDLSHESATEDVCEGLAPETLKTEGSDDSAPEKVVENKDYPAIHKALKSDTQKKYDTFSSRTKGRINAIIQTHTDISISKIITEAENESEVIRFLEEIECMEVPVNPEVKKWTTRVV